MDAGDTSARTVVARAAPITSVSGCHPRFITLPIPALDMFPFLQRSEDPTRGYLETHLTT